MSSFIRLFSYTKGSRVRLALGVLGGAVEQCIAAFLAARLFGQAINLAPNGMGAAVRVILPAIPVLGLLMLLHGAARFAREKACAQSAARLRCAVMQKAMGATLESMRSVESARVLTALSSDVGAAFENMASVLVVPATAVLLGLGGLLYISRMEPSLGFAVLILAAIQAAYSFALAMRMQKSGKRLLRARSETCGNLQETMEGIVPARMDGLLPALNLRFQQTSRKEQEQAVRYGSLSGIVGGANNAAAQIGEKLLLLLSGFLALDGSLTQGQMVEVSQLAGNVTGICNVSRVLTDTQMAAAGASRVFELLEKLQEEPSGTQSAKPGPPSIEAHSLTFAYPGKAAVLQNVSFELKAGKLTLLMGKSGSGKTTLLRLLQAMELPASGELRICGVPSTAWDRRALRARIAYVPQQPVFFSGTVLENLLNDAKGEQASAVWAAKQAQIHERICALRDGYQTHLSDARNVLSGGELQRLALARALCRGADILILDEPTSALDGENERLLYQAIRSALKNRIVVLCTHRISAIELADCALLLEEGKLTQQRPSFDA